MAKSSIPPDSSDGFFSLRTGWRTLDSLDAEEKDGLKNFAPFEKAMHTISTPAIQPLPFYESAWLVRLKLKNMDVNPGVHIDLVEILAG